MFIFILCDLFLVSDFDDSYSTDSSSDYENGFRSQSYKITQSLDKFSYTTESNISISSSDEGLTNPESFLMPSLFPNVPPYLAFSSNTSKGPEVPPDLYRILKWRVTNVMPKVVRCVLANSGVRLLKSKNTLQTNVNFDNLFYVKIFTDGCIRGYTRMERNY